jgi:MATE family multidrug resistance protein
MMIALVNMGMSVTDAAMVTALFGTDAFAAVAVGSDLYSILFYMGAGVVAGLSPFYTAAATREDAARAERLERIGWRLVTLCALMGVPAVWLASHWLAALGLDADLLAQGQGYTRTMALTLVPMLGVVLLRTLLTAAGRPKLFLKVTLTMLPLNAAANWVLMVGPGPLPAFGPTGAGLSSFLVACGTLLVLLVILRRTLPRTAGADRSAFAWAELAPILRVGVPIGVATIAEMGIWLGATLYAARFGAAEVAAHTLALRTAGVAYALPAALLQASMVRTARAEALGDARASRAVVISSLGLSIAFGAALCLLLVGLASPLAHAFFDDGELGRAAAQQAVWLLVILGLTELVLGPGSAATGLLRGRKDARAPMIHVLIGHWVVGMPLALWLSVGIDLGVVGLWIALALGTLVAALLSLGRLWVHSRSRTSAGIG